MKKHLTKKQAIDESIAHWERMIAWVKKQSQYKPVSSNSMLRDLGENWYGASCPLCTWSDTRSSVYITRHGLHKDECDFCPLQKKYGPCVKTYFGQAVENKWSSVTHVRTWGEWLTHAEVLLTQLKSLKN